MANTTPRKGKHVILTKGERMIVANTADRLLNGKQTREGVTAYYEAAAELAEKRGDPKGAARQRYILKKILTDAAPT